MHFYISKDIIAGYLDNLKNFYFAYNNPLFWLLILTLFLILLRAWQFKKAFSFSLIVAAILLLTTQSEAFINKALSSFTAQIDPFLIRLVSLFLICVILFYYALIKE